MYTNPILKILLSWITIILAFIVFFPLGIVLLIIRCIKDYKTTILVSRILSIITFIFLITFVLVFFQMASEGLETSDIIALAFAFAIIAALFIIFKKFLPDAVIAQQYIKEIVRKQEHNIDNIARNLNIPYEKAVKDIESLIAKGFFKNATIDNATRQIILPDSNSITDGELQKSQETNLENERDIDWNAMAGQTEQAAALQPRVVQCKSCGANNSVVNGVSECEYCGSPL